MRRIPGGEGGEVDEDDLPVRPRWAGALAGAGAALLADVVWHLACTRSDLEHLLGWHLGAGIAMVLVGAVVGSIWPGRWVGAR